MYCGLLPTFKIKGNTKFWLKVSENGDVPFFLIQVHVYSDLGGEGEGGWIYSRIRISPYSLVKNKNNLQS